MTTSTPTRATELVHNLRLTPRFRLGRGRLLVERNLMVYRRIWIVIVTGFFEPLFYLLSIGLGLGKLVGDVHVGNAVVDYKTFVAPALLAASAMNGGVYEATMNIFFKLKYAKVYDAILATPVGVRDVAVGEIAFALMRGGAYSAVFLLIMAVMGLIASWWAVLAFPAALLIGFAFAAAGMAGTCFMRSWQDFEFVTLATLPLFLFSATFYPLSTYSRGLQWVVAATPLYQGVALCRGLTTGGVTWSLLGHAAYLAALGGLGVYVASRRLGALLLR